MEHIPDVAGRHAESVWEDFAMQVLTLFRLQENGRFLGCVQNRALGTRTSFSKVYLAAKFQLHLLAVSILDIVWDFHL